jgi:hypothetical protein
MAAWTVGELKRRLAREQGIRVGTDRGGRTGRLYALDSGRYAVNFGYDRTEEKRATLDDVVVFLQREGMQP